MFGKVGTVLSLLSFPSFCVGLLGGRDGGFVLGTFALLLAAFLIALERRLLKLEHQARPQHQGE